METGPALAMAQGSSKSSLLRWVTARSPTNYNMLLFRTLNREMQQPNANQDTLAALFRDKLMPLRMWWLKRMPGALKMFKQGLEHKKHGVPGCLNFVDARTSWFDGVVRDALSKHGISQVVVVAAGFDTRAYRIGAKYKGVTFFEVDLPHASKKKQQLVEELLQPEATFPRPTFLAADLSQQPLDTLLLSAAATPAPAPAEPAGNTAAAAAGSGSSQGSKGFDPSRPTLFTVEGLVYYLSEEAVRGLFGALLRVAAPGSRVAFDFLNKQVLEGSVAMPPAYRVTATSVANKGEPFISGIQDSREAVQAFLNSVSATSPVSPAAQAAPTAPPAVPAPADPVAAGCAAESDTPAAAAAGAGGVGVKLCWEVVDYLGPKEMVSQQLPHLTWDDELPPILSFYSFASAQVVAA